MTHIYEATTADKALLEKLHPLMAQLSGSLTPTLEQLVRMVEAPLCHLLVAEEKGVIVGMLTLALYDTLGARRAWIEDVVVSSSARGRGIGRALVERARDKACEAGATTLALTSAPHRTAARTLYRSEGFEQVDTTLFRINNLDKSE